MLTLSPYWFFALAAVTVLMQALIAAVWFAIGGLGGQRQLLKSYRELHGELERIDGRIDREVRTRTGRESQEKRKEGVSIDEQARQTLAEKVEAPTPLERPSLIGRV